MNDLLLLKCHFNNRKNPNKPGLANLPKGQSVDLNHLTDLENELQNILKYWEGNNDIEGALVSVHYRTVVAKSNRIRAFLSEKSHSPLESIRGSKFVFVPQEQGHYKQKHVFTHYISLISLRDTINTLHKVNQIAKQKYNSKITYDCLEKIRETNWKFENISKTVFVNYIVDAYWVEKFDIDRFSDEIKGNSIVTVYKTVSDTKALLKKFGIEIDRAKMIDDTTLLLNPDEVKVLLNKASYLVAMNLTDFSKIEKINVFKFNSEEIFQKSIPNPTNEPKIGVIDTQFDENVYFNKWVEYKNLLSTEISLESDDYIHGTAVSSIIVDGPSLNPELDDGCGRFKVKHFGVATSSGFGSFFILKQIRNIVESNREIKVWNLSLGSVLEIKPSYISPEAAELDKIQCEFDVIFIVAGTNDNKKTGKKKIGAPADSLNSLVVNATNFNGESASYTRCGPVLSFFNKPDLSYYGGDKDREIIACGPNGVIKVSGTSFAAPWIARKMAYLIHIMGFSRELAKAVIIDSAAGWDRKDDNSHKMGYGIVPKHISDIVHSKDDEIKFMMTGKIEDFETFAYNIPVPHTDKGFPFLAKATLVYFPKCDRNQGVDYTSTELDLHFGRIKVNKENKTTIKSIDQNKQSEEGVNVIHEKDARNFYRKWDNVKHIADRVIDNPKPRKEYEKGNWGLSIKTKERSQIKAGKGITFGVVATLREIYGKNRISDFIKLCQVQGLLVIPVNVQNHIEIYQHAEEEIKFE